MDKIVLRENRPVAIVFAKDGRVVTGGANGTQLKLKEWSGISEQKWCMHKERSYPGNSYQIRRSGEPLVFDVSGASKDNSAKVLCYTSSDGHHHQCWTLDRLTDGSFRLAAYHSDKVLDAQGGDGPKLIQYAWNKSAAQRWKIGELIPYGEAVAFQTHHEMFLMAHTDGSVGVAKEVRGWEKFTLVREDGSTEGVLSYGDRVAIRTHRDTFLTVQSNGEITNNVKHIKGWELFTVTRPDGSMAKGPVLLQDGMALRGAHSHWLMAKPDGEIVASASLPRSWEQLTVYPDPDTRFRDRVIYRHLTYGRSDRDYQLLIPLFRCVRPATGIHADLAKSLTGLGTALVNLGGTGLFSTPVGVGIAASGLAVLSGASIAILIDKDREPDQLYMVANGKKVWPQGTYKTVHSDDGWQELKEPIEAYGRGRVAITLMEYDSGSGDDVLGKLEIDMDGVELLDGCYGGPITVLNEAEDSLYELYFQVS